MTTNVTGHRAALAGTAALVLLALLVLAGCSVGDATQRSATAAGTGTDMVAAPTASAAGATAVARVLDNLQVLASRPHVAGYQRSCSNGEGCVFGPAWADVDRNGCDPRIICTAAS